MAGLKSYIPQLSAPSEPGNHRPVASCFPGPDDGPCWEMCDFPMGMGSCYMKPSAEYKLCDGVDVTRFTPVLQMLHVA